MEELKQCENCEKTFTEKVFQCKICKIKMKEYPCPMFETCHKCKSCHQVHSTKSNIYRHGQQTHVAYKKRPIIKRCWICHKEYNTSCHQHKENCVPCTNL